MADTQMANTVEWAIIGGTGVYDAEALENPCKQTVQTPYGPVSYVWGTHAGHRVAFMPRHGASHQTPPHQVNYKANLFALKQAGVKRILATAAVGSMRKSLPPGSLVIVDQFLDFTKARPVTYFENGEAVAHVDMSDPYCGGLRAHLERTAAACAIAVSAGGTYVVTEGPRFETPAEIRAFAILGGDVVGMTSVPEVVLAKELGMCYASVAMVTNMCAGMTANPLTHEEVVAEMSKNVHLLRTLFFRAVSAEPDYSCNCEGATGGLRPREVRA
jgi:5'-methylthioadenosine phosphorylase